MTLNCDHNICGFSDVGFFWIFLDFFGTGELRSLSPKKGGNLYFFKRTIYNFSAAGDHFLRGLKVIKLTFPRSWSSDPDFFRGSWGSWSSDPGFPGVPGVPELLGSGGVPVRENFRVPGPRIWGPGPRILGFWGGYPGSGVGPRKCHFFGSGTPFPEKRHKSPGGGIS